MKFLKKFDKIFDSSLKYFTGTLIILLTIIVNAMVFSRYVLRVQMGGIEELPVYFMCVCIWLGGVRVSRDDKHVKIEIIYSLIKNERAQLWVKAISSLAAALVLTYFIGSTWQLVTRTFDNGTISPSLGFPLWIAYMFALIGSVGMTIYTYVNTIKYVMKAVKKA